LGDGWISWVWPDLVMLLVRLTMGDTAMQVCCMHGLEPFDQAEEVWMASHSSSDFPLICESA